MIKMGSKVRDSISGFTGLVTGRFEYLYGCVRLCISPQDLHDGKPIDSQIFDEQQCELLEEIAPKVSKASSAKVGGPRSDPKPRAMPRR